ncbi:protein vav [Bacillus rossius redtenbacheri]|uniref:protein vav n=1 Tax=Bacillus rossius redtenbacheri TaxID=93214 RepID=UPI002FDD0812
MARNDDCWRKCARWLTDCGILRNDHKANWPEAVVSDLANTLRDGVLLCNLLNALDPGCIDMKDVNQKPQLAQFLCLRNIKVFLHTCHLVFGLKETDLFEPSVLYELTDFYKVLNTLSKLSNCPKVQRNKIPGFLIHKNRTASEEDIYRDLNPVDDIARRMHDEDVEYGSYYALANENEVYEDLCSIARRIVAEELPHSTHSFEKRDFVIKELVETEKNYKEVLETLHKSFMKPLCSMLKEEDIQIIFGRIKELSEIHCGFYSHLLKAVAPGSLARLSDVFINWREKFLVYGEYCANLTRAQEHVLELCSRSEIFNQNLVKCEQETNQGKFKLQDILSVPMQRILKYPLLLDKLIKETQPTHEDYRGLERAKEAMVDVAQFINEVKRDSDTLDIMRKIQDSIADLQMPEHTELKDYGSLVKDGELKIKAHDDQKIKLRYVFLFDQVMIMCKLLRGESYSYRESVRLQEYKVEDVSNRRILRGDARWNYHFFLVSRSERTAYTLYTRSDELKRKWIEAIQSALDNMEPPGMKKTDHKFLMHSFDRPVICHHCSKFLKGLILQGYRCQKCDIAVHKLCIEYSGRCGAPLPPPRPPRQDPPPYSCPDPSLRDHLWFVGEMGRDAASTLLERHVDGTYLLRIRPQGASHPSETVYALSLKADGRVKHMKVHEKVIEGVTHYYLSEARFFRSIIDLIATYEHASLSENFVGLDEGLKWPYHRIVAIADFDFSPQESNQLALRKGCQVVVVSKEGDDKGWWKGRIQDKVGFFPKVYVHVVQEAD